MVNTLIIVAQYLFGWTVLTVALSWLFALVYPYAARQFFKVGVVRSAFYILFFALFAPATTLITLLILSSPTWAYFIVKPHCHGNLCEPHSLEIVMETMLSTVMLSVGVAGIIVIGLLMTRQLIKSGRLSRMLERLSEMDDSGYLRFENPNYVAWCFGMFKPKVFLSSGLVESFSNEERQVILTHELVHAFQYHNLRKWLVNWATFIWPKKIRQQIRQDFSRACESICDVKAFHALNNSMKITTFVNTLRKVSSMQTSETSQANEAAQTNQAVWQLRFETLQKELTSKNSSYTTVMCQRVFISLLVTAFWVILVAILVYLGHPLLENLLY